MLKTKPKHSLKLKVSLSSVVSIIVEKIKTEIKELILFLNFIEVLII